MKAIRVKFKGPGNRTPACWIASDSDGNKAKVTRGEKDTSDSTSLRSGIRSLSGEELAVHKLCEKMGWSGRLHGGGLGPCEYVYVFENVDPVVVKGRW
jgi:hypothetical protein